MSKDFQLCLTGGSNQLARRSKSSSNVATLSKTAKAVKGKKLPEAIEDDSESATVKSTKKSSLKVLLT